MLKFYQEMQYTKSVNTTVCMPDLVIIKYFQNNTTEIKRIVFTYLDLLPFALAVPTQQQEWMVVNPGYVNTILLISIVLFWKYFIITKSDIHTIVLNEFVYCIS